MNTTVLQRIFQDKFGITLSPTELQELTQTTDTDGRSPFRPRQQTDLTLVPRADDPRPTFYATNQVPRDWNTTAQHEYPKLLWSPAGVEVTVPAGKDAKSQEQALLKQGYGSIPPADITPMDAIAREMAQLSDEDRALVIDMQRQARMNKIQEKIARLSDAELAAIAGTAPAAKGKKTA